jgi:hypothetical protein
VQSDSGQIPFKQRFSMSYITGTHHFKAGMTVDESLPRDTYTDRGPTPYTYTFRSGTPISLTEYASPSLTGEVKVRPDLAVFAQDQWSVKRVTLNLGLRYEYHRTYASPIDTLPGPLVDAHNLPGLDCIPCWHDLDPRLGVVWDVFGDGKTAVKANFGRYVSLVSWVNSKLFNPQNAIVASTTRSWTTTRPWNADLTPNCDLRNPLANGECGPMANKSFGQELITTTPDPNWISGWGKRPYSWSGSVSVDRQLTNGVALTVGYYRTTFGNFTTTRNTMVSPSDYDPYCITAPVDPRLPSSVSGQQICGLYDIKPSKFGQVNNVVTLASNYGNQTEYYNGADVSLVARLPHGINVSGGWNIGDAISTLQVWPGNVTSKANQCFTVNSPQDQYFYLNNGALTSCATNPPYQNLFKVNGSVQLPWGLQTAAVFQSIPGPNYDAIYTATTAQIAPSLGRPLAGGVQTVNINLVPSLSQFADYRINQLDVRLTKILRLTRGRIQLNLDVYNALNGSYVLWGNTTYGTNGANWLKPTSTLDARLIKFGAQFDF